MSDGLQPDYISCGCFTTSAREMSTNCEQIIFYHHPDRRLPVWPLVRDATGQAELSRTSRSLGQTTADSSPVDTESPGRAQCCQQPAPVRSSQPARALAALARSTAHRAGSKYSVRPLESSVGRCAGSVEIRGKKQWWWTASLRPIFRAGEVKGEHEKSSTRKPSAFRCEWLRGRVGEVGRGQGQRLLTSGGRRARRAWPGPMRSFPQAHSHHKRTHDP